MKKILSILFIVVITSSCTQRIAKIDLNGEQAYNLDSDIWMKKIEENEKNKGYVFVEPGETLYSIAMKHNIIYQNLASENNLEWPYKLKVGQKLLLPSVITHNTQESETPKKVAEKKETISKLSKQAPTTSNKTVEIIKSTVNFKWPINGKIIIPFGPKARGIRHDGINLAASVGTPVKATSNGNVIYSGDELSRYGRLVIVKHDNDWYSAYAHLNEIAANKGDKIKQGQIIGYVGKTGNVSEPQLHFALRRGKTPLDPIKFLPKKINSR